MSWKRLVLLAASVPLGGAVVLALLSLLARRPADLGPVDGNLRPCPDTPNCVCTRAADEHFMEPIPYEGSAREAMARLREVLATFPRGRVVTATDTYLHADFTSLVFRFVDDVEFLLDPEARVIHFRSASRAGRSDLGVNRRRLEAVRRAFREHGEARAGVPAL